MRRPSHVTRRTGPFAGVCAADSGARYCQHCGADETGVVAESARLDGYRRYVRFRLECVQSPHRLFQETWNLCDYTAADADDARVEVSCQVAYRCRQGVRYVFDETCCGFVTALPGLLHVGRIVRVA